MLNQYANETLRIGVAPPSYVRDRMFKIARGEKPHQNEPKVWVSSLDALYKVLSEKNMLLLEIIRSAQPQSVTELAELTHRAVSNVSRTLHSLERLGIVEMREQDDGRKIPVLLWRGDKIELDFAASRGRAASRGLDTSDW